MIAVATAGRRSLRQANPATVAGRSAPGAGMWAALALLLAAPVAAASGEVEAGPLFVALENGRDQDCLDPLLCLAAFSGGDPRSSELDLRQEFHRLAIGIRSGVALPLPLLPGGELVEIDSDDASLPNPIMPVLARHGGVLTPSPAAGYGLVVNESAYGVTYFGPKPSEPAGFRARTFGANYTEEGWIHYDRIGPVNSGGYQDTDQHAWNLLENVCFVTRDPACEGWRDETHTQAYQGLTPNVRAGLLFGAAALETSLDGADAALPPRDAIASPALPVRIPPAAPEAPHRDRTPPRAIPPWPEPGDDATSQPRAELPSPRRPPAPEPPDTAEPTAGRSTSPLAIAAAGTGLALVLAGLYSRIRRREEALQSARRARILEIVTAHGPTSLSDLSRALSLDRTTIEHHARLLRRAGVVEVARVHKRVYVSLPGAPAPRFEPPHSLAQRRVLARAIEVGGRILRKELNPGALGIPERTVRDAITRLARQGKLLIENDGRQTYVRVLAPP